MCTIDARMFANFSLNMMLKDGSIPPSPRHVIDGDDSIPVFLLGDPAYPLMQCIPHEGVRQWWEHMSGTVLWPEHLQCAKCN